MIIDTFLFQMFPKRVEIVGDVFGFGTHGTTGINHKQNVGGPRSFFGFYFGFGAGGRQASASISWAFVVVVMMVVRRRRRKRKRKRK